MTVIIAQFVQNGMISKRRDSGPVSGKCVVDFTKLLEAIAFVLEE